ncbi:MAG: hypothetical protein JXR60_06435 [Bacteroidales bacterium]|nr:hypothetical protein [Bacteroidales bacterium]
MSEHHHDHDHQHEGEGKRLGKGSGHGRNKGGGFGSGGLCVCTKCGHQQAHQTGIKCTTIKCPDCGHTLIRQELLKKK